MVRVSAIWRHPIKAHGREALQNVTLAKGQTMPWDRRWAVAHALAKSGGQAWAPCVNYSRGSKVPELMAINARCDEVTGLVTLSHPERPDLSFDPDRDEAEFLQWVAPIMPPERTASAHIHRVPCRGMTDTDYPSVSLLNLASHAQVAARLGQDISPLRWRCNIHIEGLEPWEEEGWIGKTIQVGEVEFIIRDPIKRCMATTANPKTGMRDADTLGTLNSNWNHQNFGVYGEVTRAGCISIGDLVEVQ